jgi:hypothetical protein
MNLAQWKRLGDNSKTDMVCDPAPGRKPRNSSCHLPAPESGSEQGEKLWFINR